jgi:hypothetical protein
LSGSYTSGSCPKPRIGVDQRQPEWRCDLPFTVRQP